MKAFILWISNFLTFFLVFGLTSAREGLTQEDILRIHQQLSQQDNTDDAVSAYQTNVVHGESVSNPDAVSSVSVKFHIKDPDTIVGTIENQKSNGAKSDLRQKIIRIKNPIQKAERQHRQNQQTIDSNAKGSNQYAAMQYSLPPDDFINQMRADNQIQLQNIPQYTNTQQPLYKYQSVSAGLNYVTDQSGIKYTSSPAPPLQYGKRHDSPYQSYSGTATPVPQLASSGHIDNYHVTPTPTVEFLSSPNPNNQYSVTSGAVNYAGPITNFNSNPLSQIQYSPQLDEPPYTSTPIPEYGNRIGPSSTTTHYENTDYNKNMQIDHFNHAVSGVRYPFNMPQFQNEVTTETPLSTTTINNQGAWRVTLNKENGYDSVANFYANYQSQLNNDMTSGRNELNQRSRNAYEDSKSNARGFDREVAQQATYSHGDYGWKLNGKKSKNIYEVDPSGGVPAYYSTGNTVQRVESHQPNSFMNSLGQQINNIKSSQSLSYKPQSNEPQDINVGYSIDFGSNKNNNRGHNFADMMMAVQGSQQPQTSQQALNSMSFSDNNKHPPESHQYDQYNSNSDSIQHSANMQSDIALQTNPSNGLYSPVNIGNSNSPSVNGISQNVVSTFYGNMYKDSGIPNKDHTKLNYYGPNTELLSGSESKHQYEQSALSQFQPYIYAQQHRSTASPDLVTASPYNMFRNDVKVNYHFDHAKALKDIQPIDLTNVVRNKNEGTINNNAYPYYVNSPRYAQYSQTVVNDLSKTYSPKDSSQYTSEYLKTDNSNNLKNYHDYNKLLTDSYYKDKNVGYGYNIQSKPDNVISPSEATNLRESFNLDLQKRTPHELQKTYLQNENLKQLQTTNIHQTPAVFQFGYQSKSIRGPEQVKSLFEINNTNDRPQSYSLGSINNLNSQVTRLNQDISTHNLEASNNLLNKLNLLDNEHTIGFSRPGEFNLQNQALITVNGINVANPYNIDLNLVSELLKGKSAVDETRMVPLRDHLSRMIPLKLDTSPFQQILSKSENANHQKHDLIPTLHSKKDYTGYRNLGSVGFAQYGSTEEEIETNPSGFDETQYDESGMTGPQNSYQAIFKHSRSHEDDNGSLPIITADASNIHLVNTLLEQTKFNLQQEPEAADENEFTNQHDDEQENFENYKLKQTHTYEVRDPHSSGSDNHPNSLAPGRNNISLKQLNDADEPYPLLKPPRPPLNRHLENRKNKNRVRFHRVANLKQNRLPNKTTYYAENPSANGYDTNARAPINVRPPSVLKRKTSTIITE